MGRVPPVSSQRVGPERAPGCNGPEWEAEGHLLLQNQGWRGQCQGGQMSSAARVVGELVRSVSECPSRV